MENIPVSNFIIIIKMTFPKRDNMLLDVTILMFTGACLFIKVSNSKGTVEALSIS